jgi:hypothetical protein
MGACGRLLRVVKITVCFDVCLAMRARDYTSVSAQTIEGSPKRSVSGGSEIAAWKGQSNEHSRSEH